jgi:membrane protein
VHKRWKLSSPGTLLATLLIVAITFIFSYWVNKFGTYNKVYGSIGTILILMLLIYFNSLVILIGYELNVSIHHLKVMAEERSEKETQDKIV